ncbi:MAG: DinB family protein [Planctomycetia bacterium]|nr:DinB family protein [Planctomycetia bacterium]
MLDCVKNSLVAQFHAALAVLEQCVTRCPEEAWDAPVGDYPFWHVAYHALFYADLYLSRDEASFRAPALHRQDYQFFGRRPWPPHEPVVADQPYSKDEIAAYLALCRRKASEAIAAETPATLDGPSGFPWYKISRLEFHLNNIRHVQHHAAQLSLALRKRSGIEIEWVATG